MEEMKKFLRYVVPGLVFFVEFVGCIGVILLFTDSNFLHDLILKIINKETVGKSIGIFLLSGGLGAFFATLYHFSLSFSILSFMNVDYSKLLEYCVENGKIKLISWDRKDISYKCLSRTGQWRVLSSFWFSMRSESDIFQKAERRSETLHDIAHGQGTQLVGSIFVFLSIVFFSFYYKGFSIDIRWYSLPFFLVIIHFFGYFRIKHSIQTILGNIFEVQLRKHCEVYQLFVNKKDLKC